MLRQGISMKTVMMNEKKKLMVRKAKKKRMASNEQAHMPRSVLKSRNTMKISFIRKTPYDRREKGTQKSCDSNNFSGFINSHPRIISKTMIEYPRMNTGLAKTKNIKLANMLTSLGLLLIHCK